MAYFQILGSGPSDITTPDGIGHNRRRPASALMQHISTYLLFDATPFAIEQAEQALSITHVALTATTGPQIAGLRALDKWLEGPATLYIPKGAEKAILKAAGPFTRLEVSTFPTKAGAVLETKDLRILPFRTGSDAAARWGFHVDTGKKRVTYAPALADIPEGAAPHFDKTDLLVVDGGGWDKDTPQHTGAVNRIPEWLDRGNEAVIFTALGDRTPPHTLAVSSVKRFSHKVDVAFDFMKFPLGR